MNNTKSNQDWNIDGCERMAGAVVIQAVRDYRSALKRLYRHPNDIGANKIRDDCERFFECEVSTYSVIDGLAIMDAVRKRVDKEMNGNG